MKLSKINPTMSFMGTQSFSAWVHPFWTEFHFCNMAARMLHELSPWWPLWSHIFSHLSYAHLSPGALNCFQILWFIRHLLDSRLLQVWFFLPQTFFLIILPRYLGPQCECQFWWGSPAWVSTLTSALRAPWANPHHSTNHPILKAPIYCCLPWIP